MTSRIKGLYAVTPDVTDTPALLAQVEAALLGGVSLLQYRNKLANDALREVQARAVRNLCRQHAVPLIINDHVRLALEIDAEGVHLGGTDGEISEARRVLGAHKIIGASCYDQLDLALQAKAQGADYVAFGACFSSGTKPLAVRAPLALFGQAKQQVGLPAVAIGGITAENAALAIGAGADAIAVIGALWNAPDIAQSARHFSQLFTQVSTS